MAFLAKGKLIAVAGAAVLSLLTGIAQAAHAATAPPDSKSGRRTSPTRQGPPASRARALQRWPAQNTPRQPIRADRAVKKAFSGSVESFMQRRGGNVIISKGRSLKKSNAALFNKIESTYGVSPGVLLAIWGMETGFGASMGKQNTVSAIVTLAYDCRRPGFFTPHAIGALLLVDRGALSAGSVGAMHGEIGHTQFLPGNVVKYGVGNKNLRDKSTALMSTANFLRAHGWNAGAGAAGQYGRDRRLEFGKRLSAGHCPHRRGHRRRIECSIPNKKARPCCRAFLFVRVPVSPSACAPPACAASAR